MTPGSGYTSQPTVSIVGGGGTGTTATAEVRGPIQTDQCYFWWFFIYI